MPRYPRHPFWSSARAVFGVPHGKRNDLAFFPVAQPMIRRRNADIHALAMKASDLAAVLSRITEWYRRICGHHQNRSNTLGWLTCVNIEITSATIFRDSKIIFTNPDDITIVISLSQRLWELRLQRRAFPTRHTTIIIARLCLTRIYNIITRIIMLRLPFCRLAVKCRIKRYIKHFLFFEQESAFPNVQP